MVASALTLLVVPWLQVEPTRERVAAETELAAGERLALDNQIFQAENAARSTLAMILASASGILGAAVIWRRFELMRELKAHERFANAVEHLASERGDGSARMDVRLGGIYALEGLAAESTNVYWPAMEVLTAYVRDHAPFRPSSPPVASARPAADIQAIVSILGRRRLPDGPGEQRLLDLRETDLRGANLSGARLEGLSLQGAHLERVEATRAVLRGSNLREAWLSGASMTAADLDGASLSRANLEGARLNGARLAGADLSGANLRGADLWEANLRGCNLKEADLRGADLSGCLLDEAILWRADLQDAVLAGARLRETHLERANLAGASGLTWEQGEDAYTDENTILPEYLVPNASAPVPPGNVVQLSNAPRRRAAPKLPVGTPEPQAKPRKPRPAARSAP